MVKIIDFLAKKGKEMGDRRREREKAEREFQASIKKDVDKARNAARKKAQISRATSEGTSLGSGKKKSGVMGFMANLGTFAEGVSKQGDHDPFGMTGRSGGGIGMDPDLFSFGRSAPVHKKKRRPK